MHIALVKNKQRRYEAIDLYLLMSLIKFMRFSVKDPTSKIQCSTQDCLHRPTDLEKLLG